MATRSNIGPRAAHLAAVAALLSSTAALAQAAPGVGAEDPASSDIIVTANRREQNIIDVPLSVTAISGDTLNQRGLTQIESFVSEVPGLSIENTGRIGVRIILRGQNTGGAGATVATMFDDVVLSSASALSRASVVTPNLDLYDIERIEVLRGPQGTLYGATAQGGLLKYVSRKPDLSNFGGSAEAGLDTVRWGETGYSLKGAVNVPILADKLALRVVGYYNDVPGYVNNPLLDLKAVNGGEMYGGRAALLFQATDALSIRLTAAKQKESYGSEGITQLVGSPLVPNGEGRNSFDVFSDRPIETLQYAGKSKGDFEFYNGVVEYDFGNALLTSSTSYSKGKRAFKIDGSNSPAGPGLTLAGAVGGLFGEPIVAIVDQENSYKKFNQEVRLGSQGDGRLTWQIGGFYSKEDVIFDQNFLTVAAADTSRPVTVLPFFPGIGGLGLGGSLTDGDYEEFSGFGEVTFKATDRFELSVGGRYSSIDQTADYTTFAGLFTGVVDAFYPEFKSSESKFTYSVAPLFRATEEVSVYARLATGYRPGGPLTTPGAGTLFPASFDPDTTTNYEVGAKGSVLSNALSFDVAFYRIDWNDVQIITPYANPDTGQLFFVTGNGGRARSQGVEWSFAGRPFPGLDIRWVGAITDAELREDAPGLGGTKGDRLPYVPEFTSSVSIDYSADLSATIAGNAGATWSHVGSQSGDFSSTNIISNNPRIPSYDTLDLRVGLTFSRFRLDLLARNITDSQGLVTYRNTGGFNAETGSGVIIQPRTYSLRVSASF
jgi:outer membrane receptor protein involved in Fe transport